MAIKVDLIKLDKPRFYNIHVQMRSGREIQGCITREDSDRLLNEIVRAGLSQNACNFLPRFLAGLVWRLIEVAVFPPFLTDLYGDYGLNKKGAIAFRIDFAEEIKIEPEWYTLAGIDS